MGHVQDDDDDDDEEEILIPIKLTKPGATSDAATQDATPASLAAELQRVVTLSPRVETVAAKRVLLILDLNGLLLEREPVIRRPEQVSVANAPPPSSTVGVYNVWDRPHASSFLSFCFEHFDVAVWSSAQDKNIRPLLNRAMSPEQLKRLVFVWDQSYCTAAGKSPSNPHKPMFLKEISKVWAEHPKYTIENTLLLDDTKEKAARNPPHTSVHPKEWTKFAPHDDALSDSGAIRVYLATVACRDPGCSVPEHVKSKPFDAGE